MDVKRVIPYIRKDPRIALLRKLPHVDFGLSALLGLLILLEAAASIGFLLASGLLIGSLPQLSAGMNASGSTSRLVILVIAVAATLLVMQLAAPFRLALTQSLGRRLETSLQQDTMRASFAANGIQLLEDPQSEDLVNQMRGVAMGQYTPALAVWGLAEFLLIRLGILSSLALIAVFSRWWLATGLLLALLFVRARARESVTEGVKSLLGTTQLLRRAGYFLDIALTPGAAKEVRIFGLSQWLTSRMRCESTSAMEGVWRQRRRSTVTTIPWLGLILLGAVLATFLVLARLAISADLSLADVAIVGPAVVNLAIGMLTFTHTDAWLEHGSMAVPAAVEFERRAETQPTGATRSAVDLPVHEIRFEQVGFTYPGASAPVFRDLDLTIKADQSLAIVGENGAGKTTLIKLLCKLYLPTSGRILVDGIDLNLLDTDSWRLRLSVLFQDYVHYNSSACDNVMFGAIDRPVAEGAFDRALERAGATELVAELPARENTVLSRHYDGGTDLSGGQWQRIALARAFFAVEAGAGVLILDEPTASFDVRAEAALYDRFLELTRGLTTIVISHRFSSVRKADAICVIEGGAVVEQGKHDALLAARGRYAQMYAVQASRFTAAVDVDADSLIHQGTPQ